MLLLLLKLQWNQQLLIVKDMQSDYSDLRSDEEFPLYWWVYIHTHTQTQSGTHTRHVWLSQRLPQMRGQLKSVAHVITSPAKIRCVHCDKDTLIPSLLCPPDQRLSQRSVFINVQLHPAHGPRCGLRYFLYGGGGPRAQHHPRVTGQAGWGREQTGGEVRTAKGLQDDWLDWGSSLQKGAIC